RLGPIRWAPARRSRTYVGPVEGRVDGLVIGLIGGLAIGFLLAIGAGWTPLGALTGTLVSGVAGSAVGSLIGSLIAARRLATKPARRRGGISRDNVGLGLAFALVTGASGRWSALGFGWAFVFGLGIW